MIDQAELWLRQQSVPVVRVRYHQGDVARIEVEPAHIERLCRTELREQLVAHFESLGFKFVALDLKGFRSGSLNTLVPLEHLERSVDRSATNLCGPLRLRGLCVNPDYS